MKIRGGWMAAAVMGCMVLGARAWGAELSKEERAFFDKHVSELVQITPTQMGDAAVVKVFSAPALNVEIKMKQADGDQTQSMVIAHVGEKLMDMTRPSTDAAMPEFPKMVKNFKLKTDEDAKTMQAALDAVYPVIGDDDKKAVSFSHNGTEWTFIRGKFFDKHMGFVFKTDGNGMIVEARYSLKVP